MIVTIDINTNEKRACVGVSMVMRSNFAHAIIVITDVLVIIVIGKYKGQETAERTMKLVVLNQTWIRRMVEGELDLCIRAITELNVIGLLELVRDRMTIVRSMWEGIASRIRWTGTLMGMKMAARRAMGNGW